MMLLSPKTKLQLKVFAPAIAIILIGIPYTIAYWHRPAPFPPQLLVDPAFVYVGMVYLVAPGHLVLAIAPEHRHHSIRTWRWIGLTYIVLWFMMMTSGFEKLCGASF